MSDNFLFNTGRRAERELYNPLPEREPDPVEAMKGYAGTLTALLDGHFSKVTQGTERTQHAHSVNFGVIVRAIAARVDEIDEGTRHLIERPRLHLAWPSNHKPIGLDELAAVGFTHDDIAAFGGQAAMHDGNKELLAEIAKRREAVTTKKTKGGKR